MKIEFPEYFNENPSFKSLMIGTEKFVDYAHQLDSIKNIQLTINQSFFVYVVHGQAKFITPTKVTFANEGEAILVRKGAYIMSESLSDTNHEFKAFLFFISDEMIIDFFAEYQLEFTPDSSQKEDSATIPIFLNPPFKAYLIGIRALLDEAKTHANQAYFIQLKAKELLYHLVNTESRQKVIDVFSYSYPGDFTMIKRVMETNYLQSLDIIDFAFMCEMSVSTFKSKFKEVYHTTPAKWIKEKRLSKAQQILEHTNFTVAEVASHVGFEDVGNFIKAFYIKYKINLVNRN